MTNSPVVSVLMTAYNREKYIGAAIESILSQTFDNWELIVTDDCSKDSTVSIVKEYAAKDARIKLYINEQNLGDYPNRNKAASYASGKYLKYLDADDLLYPWSLECLVSMMESNPEAKWGLCSIESQDKIFPILLSPEEAYRQHYFKKSIFHKAPLSSIIHRDAFQEVGGFTGKQHLGDFEMWHILARKYPVLLMPQGMAWYRTHDDQQMNDNRTDPFVTFKYQAITLELVNRKDCPLSINEKKIITDRTMRCIVRSIVRQLIKLNFIKAIQMKQYSKLSTSNLLLHLI